MSRNWALFVFLVAVYALIGRGTLFSSDEGGIFNTAISLIQRRSLAIGPGENVHPGKDGQLYSCREILPTLLAIPSACAGIGVHALANPLRPPVAPLGARLDGSNWPLFVTVTLLGPAAVALALWLLWHFVIADGGSREDALCLVVTAGCATPLVVYARTIFPQVFEAAWLMLAFWGALGWRQTGSPGRALLIGAACGLGLMTRAAFLPVVLPFMAFVALAGPADRRARVKALLLLAVPLAVGGAATAGVNWLRFGSPTDFGYHNPAETFSADPFRGTYGLLASPGKGLFVYAPALILPVAFLGTLWRRGRAEVLLLLAVTALYLGIYCRWYDWGGGLSWGPRFLVPLIAPWMALFGRALPSGPWPRRLLLVALPLGLVVQVPGVVLHPRWMFLDHGSIFVPQDAYPVVLARHLFAQGPDDLWLLAGPRVAGLAFGPAVLLATFAGAVAGAVLWRRAGSGRERWALLVLPGFVGLLLCTAFLRA